MSDQITQLNNLFARSLNLSSPYSIDKIEIDEETKTIIVKIVKNKDFETICPSCAKEVKVYDKMNKKWRHIDFETYKVFIEYKIPRVKCQEHGVKLSEVDWAKPRHQFTDSMEQFIYDLSCKMPLVHVGSVVDEHDTRIKRIVKNKENENA